MTAAPKPRFAALGALVNAEVQRRVRRAFLLALILGLGAVFAFGGSILPVSITSNLLLSYGVFLATYGAVLALALLWGFGSQFGDAMAVVGFARLDFEARWREATGERRIPRTADQAREWLGRHAADEGQLVQRLSVQALAGDTAAARVTLSRYPATTGHDRFEAASDAWLIDFLEGETPSLSHVDSAAASIQEPEARAHAAANVAVLRAHRAVAEGADWVAPLAAARPLVGERASGIVASRFVVSAWTLQMAGAAAFVGVALLVGRLTGVWR
jgi:hypothetical protein